MNGVFLFVIISIFIGTRKRTTSIRKVVIYKKPYLQIEQWCNYYPTPPICVQAVTLFCWFFSIVRLVLLASLVFGDMTIRIYFSQKRKIFFEISRVFKKNKSRSWEKWCTTLWDFSNKITTMLLFVFFMIFISSTLMWCAFIPCLCYYYTLLKFWDDSNGFDKYFLFRITWCRKHKTSSNRFFSTWSNLSYRFACVKMNTLLSISTPACHTVRLNWVILRMTP